MPNKNYIITFLALFSMLSLNAQTIVPINRGRSNSFRGLSVVSNKVAWVSGTGGTVGITKNGGINWDWQQVKGFDKSDFRDIEAFSANEAIIISSGSPACILKTTDGGATWNVKYQQRDTAYFLDAMDFSDKLHGFVLGDPINGKFLLLETLDGGETWDTVANAPVALKNEAAFAASGTCLRVNSNVTIVTGGSHSRMLIAPIKKPIWHEEILPLTNGAASRGAFSVAFGKNETIIAGGDYAQYKKTDSVAYIIPSRKSANQGNSPETGPAGYQSCVEYVENNIYLSTGTSGTNITTDGGKHWRKISDDSYNVCIKAKQGNLILLAGDKGKIGLFKF